MALAASCTQHLHLTLHVLLIQGRCAVGLLGRTACAGWEERYAQSPADARILKIIPNRPDQPETQDRLISRLHAQGFVGVVCNVSFDPYLESDAM